MAQLKQGEVYFFDLNGDEVGNELVEINGVQRLLKRRIQAFHEERNT